MNVKLDHVNQHTLCVRVYACVSTVDCSQEYVGFCRVSLK